MNVKRNIVLCFAFVAGGIAVSAQDLDPTVVVDRAYEGKLMEVHKPNLEMAVPDTVMRFDLDFDYSVFERPYKGSYEFNPYLLSMKPSSAVENEGVLYLRAGAGYQLHPTLDVVWSPDFKSAGNAFSLDLYARHRSFVGNYWNISDVSDDADVFEAGRGEGTWSGYDMHTEAGVSFGYDWSRGGLGLDVGYYGLHQDDRFWKRGYNALDASFNVSSKNSGVSGFVYDVDVAYRLAGDRTGLDAGGVCDLSEHNLKVSVAMGARYKAASRILVEVGGEMDSYGGYVSGSAAQIYVLPHYVYEKGVFRADLGVLVSKVIRYDGHGQDYAFFRDEVNEQFVYPDASISISLVPKALSFYAKAGGGSRIDGYASILKDNHHADFSVPGYRQSYPGEPDRQDEYFGYKPGVSVERIRLTAGFEGRVGSSFSYNLYGGYSNFSGGLLDALAYVAAPGMSVFVAGLEYKPYSSTFAGARMLFKNERFMADVGLAFANAQGEAFAEGSLCLKPAAFQADMALEYNYNRRIYAGVDCGFVSARTSAVPAAVIPAYADLGASFEYVTSRRLSFWLRGDNLLGMTIQRNPLYAEKGVYFTAGICLNL